MKLVRVSKIESVVPAPVGGMPYYSRLSCRAYSFPLAMAILMPLSSHRALTGWRYSAGMLSPTLISRSTRRRDMFFCRKWLSALVLWHSDLAWPIDRASPISPQGGIQELVCRGGCPCLTSFSGSLKSMPSSVMASYIVLNDWTMLLKITGFHSSFSLLLKPWA